MPKSLSSEENVTHQKIWLTYIDFCTSAAATVAGSADRVTEQLMVDILTSYDGVHAVAAYLDVDEHVVEGVVRHMLDPNWHKFYETVVFPLERADARTREAHKNGESISPNRQDYIYLMRDRNTDLYKIGRSFDPVARLDQINRNRAPGDASVELLHYFAADNGADAERRMHKDFADENIEREWFALSPEHVLGIVQTLAFESGEFVFFRVTKENDRDATDTPD